MGAQHGCGLDCAPYGFVLASGVLESARGGPQGRMLPYAIELDGNSAVS
ncbi:putative ribosomal-protein-alanine acetyltransferase [Mycobacterium xenopi 3993]|nr:putative ribosomal-protein-alanine acetyltransferase [Mycobacterium xenopi 3993]